MGLILKANNINIEYSGREILNIDELELYSYDRIGLVGNNGTGKSTLFQVLSGEISSSSCPLQRFGEFAYIKQLEDIMLDKVDDYGMLSRLNVSDIQEETMSGGEETRVKIAAALSQQVHAIFADEPTCHLDQAGTELLIEQLKYFNGALIVISHDRYFLDHVVDKIWELDNGKITEYWGNYSDYTNQKKEIRKQQEIQYEHFIYEREKLESAINEKRKQASTIDNKQKGQKSKNSNENAGRLGHQKSTGSKQKKLYQAAKNIEKRLESLGEIHAPQSLHNVRFRQSKALELHNKFPIVGEDITVKFGERTILNHSSFVIPLGAKVALTGGNGTGKTTLLKMILERANELSISPKAEIGYFSQTGYKFTMEQTILSFMKENCDYNISEIYAVLSSMGFASTDISKNLRVLSGGEIIKLLITKMLLGRYNILLMDEPGNYLDLVGMEALELMMKSYEGTILFVSHDKSLIDNAADIVLEIKDQKIVKVKDI